MQESKYFYKGIPLSKYCKDKGININTIRTRIWKKKHDKKFENYTEQEIIDMVIETCGTSVKYMYKGMTLRKYCLKNGISEKAILSRINKLRSTDNNLSNDELVTLAIEEFVNKNYKYFYEGVTLKEYCESHSDITYGTVLAYINREKKKNKDISIEEIIKQYIEKEHKGIYKYYYLGIPLKKYCEENNLNYKSIITYMSKHRNTSQFKDLSDDEFASKIINSYQPFEPKYLYQGVTLSEYCKNNKLSYYSIISYVKRKLAKDNTKNIDELIDEAIKTVNRYGIIYYYKGMPLKDYAKEKGLNVNSLRSAILRKQAKSNKPLQEIIDECVEAYQKFSIKYYYDRIPLITYCKENGLNYITIIQKYLTEYADASSISKDEAIKQIVDYYIENPKGRTKYYFKDQSLAKFCDTYGYPYLAILRRIKTLENKEKKLDKEKIISLAIKKYEERLEINKINEIFNNLKKIESKDTKQIKDICNFLKISFINVSDLVDMDFSYYQAINMIWYFFDNKTDDGYKIITDNKIKNIFSIINKLQNNNININKVELYDLIGIYKCELYDSRSEILKKESRYIYKVIFSLAKSYGIKVYNNFEDFESELKYYLLIVISRINLNNFGQIIKYIDLSVKGYFRNYLKEYIKQHDSLSLDSNTVNNDSGNKKITKIDNITCDSKYYDKDDSFSMEMMQVLETLEAKDLEFIMLKYKEDYSYDELATHFKLSIEDIKLKEREILSLLKNNDKVKVMKLK